jgi:hypothetical protein
MNNFLEQKKLKEFSNSDFRTIFSSKKYDNKYKEVWICQKLYIKIKIKKFWFFLKNKK